MFPPKPELSQHSASGPIRHRDRLHRTACTRTCVGTNFLCRPFSKIPKNRLKVNLRQLDLGCIKTNFSDYESFVIFRDSHNYSNGISRIMQLFAFGVCKKIDHGCEIVEVCAEVFHSCCSFSFSFLFCSLPIFQLSPIVEPSSVRISNKSGD